MKTRKRLQFLLILIGLTLLLISSNHAESEPFEDALREAIKARYAETGFNGKVIVNIGRATTGIRPVQRGRMLTVQAGNIPESPAGGNYLALDGVDDYAQRDSVPAIQRQLSDNLTLEAWVWLNSLPVSVEDLTTTEIIRKFPEYDFYVVEGQLGGSPRFTGIGFDYVTLDENRDLTFSINLFLVPVPLKEWVHIAVSHDAESNTVYLAVNGNVRTEADVEPTLPPISRALTIGGQDEPGRLDRFVDGSIDDVRISKTVRYRRNFTPPAGELAADRDTVALYQFNEPIDATRFADASGRAGPATGQNGAKIGGIQVDTIQAKINAAGPREVIEIPPGTYKEALTFKDGITLRGAGADKTRIEFGGDKAVLFARDIRSGEISGFTIAYTGSGNIATVWLVNSSLELTENVITGAMFSGVQINGGTPQISNNEIRNNTQNGILILEGAGGVISDNDISGNGFRGISVSDNSAPEIRNNRIFENLRAGIQLNEGSDPKIVDNEIQDNLTGGIFVNNGGGSISQNTFIKNGFGEAGTSRFSGIEVAGQSASPQILSNEIQESAGSGIFVHTEAGGLISGNIIARNGLNGIGIQEQSTSQILWNTIVDNQEGGIGVRSGATPEIRNNIIVKNQSNGIDITGATPAEAGDPTVSHNNVWGNLLGDYDGLAPGVGSIPEDPLFVDFNGGDYHLLPNSPALCASSNNSDMGAHSTQEPCPTPPHTTITFSPVEKSVGLNEEFTMDVVVEGANNFLGWQLSLRFDPAILEVVGVEEGPFLTQGGAGSFFQEGQINNNAGSLSNFASLRQGGALDGGGVILRVTFNAKGEGETALNLQNTVFSDAAAQSIAHGVVDGKVTVDDTPRCPGEDVNGDGNINILDLVLVAQNIGKNPPTNVCVDVNGDGGVNILDLVLVAGRIGKKAADPAAPGIVQTLGSGYADMLEGWLIEARAANDGSEEFRRGLAVLEQLYASIVPEQTRLLSNYPNPFNPETWIPYQLNKGSEVTLTIYGVHGQMVRRLALGYQSAGIYRDRARAVYWDGRSETGELVSSGVYFYTLQAGQFTATRKMVILK